jgi:HORMA domain-containing protein
MPSTGTRTASFTITEARYVGAKIGADLRLLNSIYGSPTLTWIDKFTEEAALLLRDGYLGTVSYGFRDASTNEWKLRLQYTATAGGHLLDSRAGSIPPNVDIDGYAFHSYLIYSWAFQELSAAKQQAVLADLPVVRVGGDEPAARYGSTTSGHGYARNGVGVARDIFTAA